MERNQDTADITSISVPDPEKNIRAGAIELGGGDFDRIIKGLHPSLYLDHEQKLKRAPLGFDADGPYIEYIKLKNFCLNAGYDDTKLDVDEILNVFKSGKPFLDYIIY